MVACLFVGPLCLLCSVSVEIDVCCVQYLLKLQETRTLEWSSLENVDFNICNAGV